MSGAAIHVDVFPTSEPLDVQCHARGNKLQIDNVTFHGMTDEHFVSVRNAIDGYLSRKKLRELEQARAATRAEGDHS